MRTNSIQAFNKKQQKIYATKTGILVDIQNIGKNKQLIAVKEQRSLRQIRPGVWLRVDVLELKDGSFSNVYDLFWDQNQADIIPTVNSSNTPYTLLEQMQEKPSTIATINGAFFFLADIADSKPLDLCYNFCIRSGKLLGLPSWDQPVVFIQKGKLHTREPRARGIMTIGKSTIEWVGANSGYAGSSDKAVLYNSKCSDVVKVRDAKSNLQIGILDNEHITTPFHKNVFDIVVTANKQGELLVTEINHGGGTHFFKGLFILQMKGDTSSCAIGDVVKPLTLDGIDLQQISSGITIGMHVLDAFYTDPIRAERKDARSIIAEDRHGYMHFMVFDGSKYIPGFHGVSARDIRPLFSKNKFKWAYFLDGGGSSRLIIRENKKLGVLANQFAFKKFKDGNILWDWQNARSLTSSLSLRVQGQ